MKSHKVQVQSILTTTLWLFISAYSDIYSLAQFSGGQTADLVYNPNALRSIIHGQHLPCMVNIQEPWLDMLCCNMFTLANLDRGNIFEIF